MHGTTPTARAKRSRKAFWLKQLHTWHWISSAISLIGLLLYPILLSQATSKLEGTLLIVEGNDTIAPLVETILDEGGGGRRH